MNELGLGVNNLITLVINTTTGGNFQITIENDSKTIEHLKKLVSKKLKVPKDRWVLIFNNR
jgi:enhancing lycopene biosynthesis protein 2